jgi:hypothetical protein
MFEEIGDDLLRCFFLTPSGRCAAKLKASHFDDI